MGEYARIEPGGQVVVDATAWIARRTGDVLTELTGDLHQWARHHADPAGGVAGADVGRGPANGPSTPGWPVIAKSWCDHMGHAVREPGLIVLDQTRMDAVVWVLLATSADDRQVAVVGVNHQRPTVHIDTAADAWAWCDADSVVITCPGGHAWTWRAGRELLTASGRPATLTVVFGPNLDAPFTTCPDCTAHHLGTRTTACGCDRSPWIICPVCGQRCGLTPPNP